MRAHIALFFLYGLGILMWPHLPTNDAIGYFDFADKRALAGAPNGLDFWSNLAFIGVGIWGLLNSLTWRKPFFLPLVGLSLGMVLTGIGSAYFHWNPNPSTLTWDRLPMTLGFASVVSLMVAERGSEKYAPAVLTTLAVAGALSVLGYQQTWWSLKPYALLQFGSLLGLLIGLWVFPKGRIEKKSWGLALSLYALAKVAEHLDRAIYDVTLQWLSGHNLKHCLAAASIFVILKSATQNLPNFPAQTQDGPTDGPTFAQ